MVYGRSWSETDLRTLFEQQEKSLLEQKTELYSQIDSWRAAFIHEIEGLVCKQRTLLEKEYNYQLQDLDQKRKDYIQILNSYEEANETEPIQELIDQCRSLKMKITTPKYARQPFEVIQFINRNPKKNISDPLAIKANSSIINGDNQAVNNQNGLRDSFSKSTYDYFSPATTAHDRNSLEKCPFCLMIFPLSMTPHDQSRHIQEHQTDY